MIGGRISRHDDTPTDRGPGTGPGSTVRLAQIIGGRYRVVAGWQWPARRTGCPGPGGPASPVAEAGPRMAVQCDSVRSDRRAPAVTIGRAPSPGAPGPSGTVTLAPCGNPGPALGTGSTRIRPGRRCLESDLPGPAVGGVA
eukprot:767510-Hanusia_phi.AAC.10